MSTARVEDTHPRRDPSAKQLIEEVNVDLSELLLKVRHGGVPIIRDTLRAARPDGSEGLVYVSSWMDDKFERCYQLMEAGNRRLLDEWIANLSNDASVREKFLRTIILSFAKGSLPSWNRDQ